MENIGKTIADQFKGYAASWAAYSTFGSFVLYLLGYLVTRFELTMLGVARNLDVLEERYFFAGAKFVVYLLATVPSLLLLLLVPAAIVWLLGRLLPAQLQSRLQTIRPSTFYLIGIIFPLLLVASTSVGLFSLCPLEEVLQMVKILDHACMVAIFLVL